MNHEMDQERPLRARELGISPGVFSPGSHNAITDVKGVLVGSLTKVEGDSIRTGATAILPHEGNLYQDKVPAGIAVANGFGKFTGSTQILELGEIETPVLLTNTLAVPQAADAIIHWTLSRPGNEQVVSVNPVVGETNDGHLNDIRKRSLTSQDFLMAIDAASSGPVAEGCVGAGTGTTAFGWKGGLGTSSRKLPANLGGYTLGALVQSNFDGLLQVLGVPVGKELGRDYLADIQATQAGESIVIVVAVDAPLSDRNLVRLVRRAFAGLARTGAAMTNGSGDYALAFSTDLSVRRTAARRSERSAIEELPNDLLSPLFLAAAEAVEEAIYNSLFTAVTTAGYQGIVEALPADRVVEILKSWSGRAV